MIFSLTIYNPIWPGSVAHVYNPSTLEAEVGRSLEVTSLANMVKPHLYQKSKINLAWWQRLVIPVTQEAEVGESLEPGR